MSAGVRRLSFLLTLVSALVAVVFVTGSIRFGAIDGMLTALGVVALAAATVGLYRSRRRPPSPEMPRPEGRIASRVPGRTLEDALDEFAPPHQATRDDDQRLWLGLRAVATEVLVRFDGDDETSARSSIGERTWTDDHAVAQYLATGSTTTGWTDRLVGRFRGQAPHMRIVSRSVAAIAAKCPDSTRRPTVETSGSDDGNESGADDAFDRSDRIRTTTRKPDESVGLAGVETGHWWGVGALALAALGVGALVESQGLILAGAIGVGYAGFARSTTVGEPTLTVEREVSNRRPEPDERVEITTTVTNDGRMPAFGLRLIDGVPAALPVVDGSCRAGATLLPGRSLSLEFTVEAKSGTHEFDPMLAIVGDLSRSAERSFLLPEETALTVTPNLESAGSTVPLQPSALRQSGRLTTANAGSGTDFHSVREYRDGDPINRIDWNRFASTGELATVQFHTERAARVLIVVDSRHEAYVAPEETATHAVDRAVDAAGTIASELLDDGDTVGLTAVGPTTRHETGEDGQTPEQLQCWIPPASGTDHRLAIRSALATHPQFSTVPAPVSRYWLSQIGRIKRQLDGETQVILLTPLVDFGGAIMARRLASGGHPVTVISPDPTTDRCASTELARICRQLRLSALHQQGISVLNWPDGESLDVTLERRAIGGNRL